MLESKKPVINLELRFPLGFESGKPHDWLVDYFPATVNGQPGLYAVLLDITDRKTGNQTVIDNIDAVAPLLEHPATRAAAS